MTRKARHHISVRRPGYCDQTAHRQALPASSPRRVPQILRRDRSKRAVRVRRSPSREQLRLAQGAVDPKMAGKAPRCQVHLIPISSS